MFYSLQHHVLISNACNWKTAFGKKKQRVRCVSRWKRLNFLFALKFSLWRISNVCVDHKCTLNRFWSLFQKWSSLLFKALSYNSHFVLRIPVNFLIFIWWPIDYLEPKIFVDFPQTRSM